MLIAKCFIPTLIAFFRTVEERPFRPRNDQLKDFSSRLRPARSVSGVR
jgi:hypothetical protein